MSNMGNIAWQLTRQEPIEALVTTDFYPLIKTSQGVVFAIAKVTGISDLSAARAAAQITAAPGCFVVSVFSAGTASSHLFINGAAQGSCTWEELTL